MNRVNLLLAFLFFLSFGQAQSFQWAGRLPDTSNSSNGNGARGTAIAIDASGNVYTVGYLDEGGLNGTCDLDPGPGTTTMTVNRMDAFIIKTSTSGALVWAKVIGSTNSDWASAVAVDANNNVYIAGAFQYTVDFDPGPGTYTMANTGGNFILKLDANGNFVWVKGFSSLSNAAIYLNDIAVDASGNVFTGGKFSGTADFDPGAGTSTVAAISTDAFVSKLDASGNFIWAKTFSVNGNTGSSVKAIALDPAGNVYSTGNFRGAGDFDPGAGTFTLSSSTSTADAGFVWKLDAAGNFGWADALQCDKMNYGTSILVDGSGNVKVSGITNGICDFDPGASTFTIQVATPGTSNHFIWNLSSAGNLVWAKQIGSNALGSPFLAVDPSGSIYLAGTYEASTNFKVDFDPGPATYTFATLSVGDLQDVYALKLDASGNFIWAEHYGGSTDQYVYAMSVDATGGVWVTGDFRCVGCDFDPGPANYVITTPDYKAFILKINGGTSVGLQQFSGSGISNEFRVYPNPGKGLFKADLSVAEGAAVQIFNTLGQKVFEQKTVSGINEFNTGDLAPGIYHCFLEKDSTKITSCKLLVE